MERIEREASKPPGLQCLDQRRAIDQAGPRYVDDARAGLHLHEPGAVDEMAGLASAGHLRHHPVAFGEEPFDWHVARLQLSLLGLRQPAALIIEDAHFESRGPQRDLASDLAQPDDAERRAEQHADAG